MIVEIRDGSPVRPIPIQEAAPHVVVEGPVAGLDEEMRELHRRALTGRE